MDWQVKYTKLARKQLSRMDHQIQRRVIEYLEERIASSNSPRNYGKQLQQSDVWRYRVGDYRILCDIQDKILVVLVLRVGHRREVYR